MAKKREKEPKGDALISTGYAARLRECADQTILNAIASGKLRGVPIFHGPRSGDIRYAVRWRDARRFAARPYATRSS